MEVLNAINETILKMDWLDKLVGYIIGLIPGLGHDSSFGHIVQYFVFDVIKIMLLLSVLIFIISYIQTYFPPTRVKRILGRFGGFFGNFVAASLGVLTPFCSCSSIPIFIGFTKSGLPLGMTFSFLITSPLSDLAAVAVLASVFNIKLALAYMILGMALGIAGGAVIQSLRMEKFVEEFVRGENSEDYDDLPMSQRERRSFARGMVKQILGNVWKFILLGVALGAIIHNWIPREFIESVLGKKSILAPVIATAIGVPIYADIFGTIPVAEALVAKGVGVGTVLSFMMAVTALSAPSILMLRKVLKPRLLWTFVGVTCTGILIIGYFFNAFGGFLL
jgi:uncharacterized membrane protein YraQ (UPF0718 family)